MHTTVKTVIIIGFVIASSCPISTASVDSDAIDWLEANQASSGPWGEGGQTPFRDAAVVLDALYQGRASDGAISAGRIAVAETNTTTVDRLSRHVSAGVAAVCDRCRPTADWNRLKMLRLGIGSDASMRLDALDDTFPCDVTVLGEP